MSQPNYKRIYTDMITLNYPDKLTDCKSILNKSNLTTIDVINLQKKLFGSENISVGQSNQRFKSYDESTIIKILKHQNKQGLNNTDLAKHFNISRNTVSKWKKLYKTKK